MARPKKNRWVCCEPEATFFKPRGIPLVELEEVCLTVEEFKAVRLKDLEGLGQEPTAVKMRISQPTLHRMLLSAHRKTADALVNGKAIRIEGGSYIIKKTRARKPSPARLASIRAEDLARKPGERVPG
jgi:predicted DNA-binding protein (UPF0251 family)